MSPDDRRLEIGRMVEERQRIKGDLVYSGNGLHRLRLALSHAQLAIDSGDNMYEGEDGSVVLRAIPSVQGCEEDTPYPDGGEILALLARRKGQKERLTELDRQLGEVGC